MKIVFISKLFTAHQIPLCDALMNRCESFFFIETEPGGKQLTGRQIRQYPQYVLSMPDSGRIEQAVSEADVLITSGFDNYLAADAIRSGKPVFRYMERPLKDGNPLHKRLLRDVRWHRRNPEGANIHVLCASAFTPLDLSEFHLLEGRMYRWGYFPFRTAYPDIDCLLDGKKDILWTARYEAWKHPEMMLSLAEYLKEKKNDARITMIGDGETYEEIREQVRERNLEERVILKGALSPGEVREQMEKASIFILSSDRKEGWGAVVNEAMNSGCAVIARDAAGCTPYLIRNGQNGFVFHDEADLFPLVLSLLEDPQRCRDAGRNAYETIDRLWNAETAAERLIVLAEAILRGGQLPQWDEGPCSRAEVLEEDWYLHGIV